MGEDPLYQTSYMGFWIKVYPNRVDFKAGPGSQSIPINQIASVQLAQMGILKVTLETSGGKKYSIPTMKKKEVQQAIYDAQARSAAGSGKYQTSVADELMKLNVLREQGVITQAEFDKQKKRLLDL
jgi:putative oligomerization/nucleic acid binding protein